MKPLEIIGRATARDDTELVLYHRDGGFQIRVNGLELMTSRAHGSEDALASIACSRLLGMATPEVLIGGLGMGFTLRAALDCLPARAVVRVAEVFPVVVEWCRGPLAHLAGRPLDDPRVAVQVADVAAVLANSPALAFDAILLDVDNGPQALSLASNHRLYQRRGIELIVRALRPRGVAAIWSADADPAFSGRLGRAGLSVQCQQVRARPHGKGPHHTIFVASKGNVPSTRQRRAAGGHSRS